MNDHIQTIRDRWDFSKKDPTTPAGSDIKALFEALDKALDERDAAYATIFDALGNLASCKPWLKSRLPFTVAKSVSDARTVIEAAHKMVEGK